MVSYFGDIFVYPYSMDYGFSPDLPEEVDTDAEEDGTHVSDQHPTSNSARDERGLESFDQGQAFDVGKLTQGIAQPAISETMRNALATIDTSPLAA
ncbi:hypothetical protein SAMN04487820_110273, partial [Actinopolyspora mzabensis]